MLTLTHQNSGGPYLTITKDTVIVGKANNSSWTVSTCDMGGMSYRFSFTVLSGDNAIMVRFSDSPNANTYNSEAGYGVYTYYNNNSQLYYYNDPNGSFLTGKGKGNGTYSVGDLIEIEYSIADGCIKIYKNNTLVVAQKTKYRRYVQFVTSGSLSAESITINYSLNTSEAVNFKSFVTAIGKRISSTTSIPYNILKKLITCSNTNESRAISIKEACNICKQILNNLDIETNGYITEITQKDSLTILSKNSAIAILDRYISVYNWIDTIYTNDISILKSDTNYKVIIADETTNSATISATLVGGGSGGGGAYGCDGDKNASYTINVYSGAPGCDSQLYISYPNNSPFTLSASGGAQKDMASIKVGGNPTNNAVGTNGNNGKQISGKAPLKDGSTILGIKGNGGQGSGGVSVTAGGATGGKTFTNQKTSNGTTYWCDGYGATNEWSGDDLTFGGGGGQGGGNTASIYKDIRRRKGNNSHKGPTAATVVASTNAGTDNGKLGTVVIGGRGGYYSGSNWGTPQPTQEEQGRTGAGIGGYGGQRRFVTDAAASSNGGNGGNSGRITGRSNKYIYFIEWEYPTSDIPGGGFVPD